MANFTSFAKLFSFMPMWVQELLKLESVWSQIGSELLELCELLSGRAESQVYQEVETLFSDYGFSDEYCQGN